MGNSNMKITKGTILRTIMLLIVIINMILKKLGIDALNIEEGTVSAFIETAIEISVIAVSFWKNNSFSKNALRADKFLKDLKESDIK